MKTYTWDYDNNLVTEWYRVGGCNKCGECCEITIYLGVVGNDGGDARDGGSGMNKKGHWHQWGMNGDSKYWEVKNMAHDEPCSCPIAGSDECVDDSDKKGLICTAWPLHPDHVKCFDSCSYRFMKLNEWNIED